MSATNCGGALIKGLQARAYRIPTDGPEADGTFAWDATTLVTVDIEAGGRTGFGYTYADASIISLIAGPLKKAIEGRDSFDISGRWAAMERAVRNLGSIRSCGVRDFCRGRRACGT